ncbi:MAG: hypothetical protein KJP07_06585 [Desulfatitalea sp.]|nr:hypothetical protein [Desulfatitalea sp.]
MFLPVQSIIALLSSIQNKLEGNGKPIVCWGHVGDLGHVEDRSPGTIAA